MLIIYLDLPTKRFHDTDNTIAKPGQSLLEKMQKKSPLDFSGRSCRWM